jgi:hypothetical protein
VAATNEQIIWGGNYFADVLPATMRWLVWDKGSASFRWRMPNWLGRRSRKRFGCSLILALLR